MGRSNGQRHVPQRNHLRANRDDRHEKKDLAFALFRPVAEATTDELYERLRDLQLEDDIPKGVKLFNHDMHNSIIQERRMRGAVRGFMAGIAVQTIFGHVESMLPAHGRAHVDANITGFDVIGRNRNILIAHVADEEGRLEEQRQTVRQLLGGLGLKMNVDKRSHVTVGVMPRGGLTATERLHVMHTALETVRDVPVDLRPVEVEYQGQRAPLADAKFLCSLRD